MSKLTFFWSKMKFSKSCLYSKLIFIKYYVLKGFCIQSFRSLRLLVAAQKIRKVAQMHYDICKFLYAKSLQTPCAKPRASRADLRLLKLSLGYLDVLCKKLRPTSTYLAKYFDLHFTKNGILWPKIAKNLVFFFELKNQLKCPSLLTIFSA